MSKQNTFCKALSNAVSFRIPGDSNSLTFNPCCLYDHYIPFHSAFYKKHREIFITSDKDFLPGCSKCKLKEKTHGRSHRTFNNSDIPDGIGDSIYKMEIVLDTTCNAACIQCGTYQSSLWRNEVARRDATYEHIQPESQIDAKINLIQNNIDISTVREFHFWGGEPLLTDTHLKFLVKIEDPSVVTLRYTTNGSIFPDDDVLKLWEKFKAVKIGISTDGVGDRFHYMRWPLKWDKFSRNIIHFRDDAPANIDYHINCCVIPLNALYLTELVEWLDANFSTHLRGPYAGRKINCNFIRGEGTLDIGCSPMSLREEIWKKLGEDHAVSNILKELPVMDPQYMLKHLEVWDPVRKLNWREIFPESAKHFK